MSGFTKVKVLRQRMAAAAALAVALAPATGVVQTPIKVPPRGGSIPSGPWSTQPQGPNGEILSGPSGAAVRGPNSGEMGRTPSYPATSAQSPHSARETHVGASTGRSFYYGGHRFHGVYAPPFVYPSGMRYRRWAVGATLPAALLSSAYAYHDYRALGLPPPLAGHEWLRYGPDLLLVNSHSGAVLHATYGVFR
jgi:Ni/Co efflux regulator RcnB